MIKNLYLHKKVRGFRIRVLMCKKFVKKNITIKASSKRNLYFSIQIDTSLYLEMIKSIF